MVQISRRATRRTKLTYANPRINPEALRKARLRQKIPQVALAAQVGISKQYLCDLEAGRYPGYNPELIEALAKALGVRASKITMKAVAA